MKRHAVMLSVILSALALPAMAQVPWVMVARRAIGRVEQLSQPAQPGQPGYDVATVMLDAPAGRVYDAALKLARQNQSIRITRADATQRRIDIAEGDRTASLSVSMLSDNLSQLVLASAAGHGEPSPTARRLERVMQVCRQMGKTCTPAG